MSGHQCPQNKNDWDTASQRLQCVDPNSYHCLRTEDGGETERCLGKVWIQEGMCPEYNSKVSKIDVFSCHNTQGCPPEIYWSNEVYKYPTCSRKISLETTTASFVGDSDLPANGKENSYIIIILSIVFVILLMLVILWLIKRKIQTTRQRNAGNTTQQTLELSPLTVNDTQHGIQQAPERSSRSDYDTQHGIRQTLERSPLTNYDRLSHENRLTQGLSPLTVHDTSNKYRVPQELSLPPVQQSTHADLDPLISDVDDLEKHGVLIFISNDENKMRQRIKSIAESEKFGKSRYEHSLDLWEPVEDVSLYLFHQPIFNVSSFMASPQHIKDMYKKVTEPQRAYFVLHFDLEKWQKYKTRLLEFDFFNKAKQRK